MECGCGRVCKSAAGLASHRRSCDFEAGVPVGGAVRQALEVTLGELVRSGRVERVDEAFVQVCRSMADALDQNAFNAQMWREYRVSLEALTDDGDADGSIDALLKELSEA